MMTTFVYGRARAKRSRYSITMSVSTFRSCASSTMKPRQASCNGSAIILARSDPSVVNSRPVSALAALPSPCLKPTCAPSSTSSSSATREAVFSQESRRGCVHTTRSS